MGVFCNHWDCTHQHTAQHTSVAVDAALWEAVLRMLCAVAQEALDARPTRIVQRATPMDDSHQSVQHQTTKPGVPGTDDRQLVLDVVKRPVVTKAAVKPVVKLAVKPVVQPAVKPLVKPPTKTSHCHNQATNTINTICSTTGCQADMLLPAGSLAEAGQQPPIATSSQPANPGSLPPNAPLPVTQHKTNQFNAVTAAHAWHTSECRFTQTSCPVIAVGAQITVPTMDAETATQQAMTAVHAVTDMQGTRSWVVQMATHTHVAVQARRLCGTAMATQTAAHAAVQTEPAMIASAQPEDTARPEDMTTEDTNTHTASHHASCCEQAPPVAPSTQRACLTQEPPVDMAAFNQDMQPVWVPLGPHRMTSARPPQPNGACPFTQPTSVQSQSSEQHSEVSSTPSWQVYVEHMVCLQALQAARQRLQGRLRNRID